MDVRLAATVLATVVSALFASACVGSSEVGCDELRDELAGLDIPAAAAWDDIEVLRTDLERVLELQRELEDRCADEQGALTDR